MNGAKILVVDDEPDILEFLNYNLQKEGFEVFLALDGKEAIKMAEKHLPDLILLDIMMPEMDGVQVCSYLRSQADFEDTIIAFLTARNEDYSQIAALDNGGDDYISKPIRPKVLVSRIKALLRRSQKQKTKDKSQLLELGELSIDLEKVLVIKNGVQIPFAKKEFELICLLASKPGKVFGREEIFRKIWGDEVIVGNRTIDVHVRKIREKIGEEKIRTIKGIGYKFDY